MNGVWLAFLAVLAVSMPMAIAWLVTALGSRLSQKILIGGYGLGFAAAGTATLCMVVAGRVAGSGEGIRLTISAPILEESLKAGAVLAAIGLAAVARGRRLTLLRCATAALAVVTAFAVGENLCYIVPLLAGPDSAMLLDTLRVRAILPPLGHAVETWPVAAAAWAGGRLGHHRVRLDARPRRRDLRLGPPAGSLRRGATLLAGWVSAVAIHAAWNTSAMVWWPNPWPLLAIVTVSGGGAVALATVAIRRERVERAAAGSTTPATRRPVLPISPR